MRIAIKQAVPALLALGALGCGSFVTGPGLTTDPNAPSAATRDQRLVAVEAAMTVQLTGTLARAVCMWMQQCAGVQRQYATLEMYNTTEDDFDTEFSQVYSGGGLIDIRAIEQDAVAAGDSVYEGVGKVLEALDVGTAADLWGDIPYSQAVSDSANPHYDAQQDVYAAVQTVLDQAITELAGAGSGPGQVDLWYGGNATKWTQLAHTLKARFYLHTAEQDPSSYAKALAEAQQGISTSANDLLSYQSSATTENNVWYQFQIVQRSGYLAMGARLVNLMVARNDPRLSNYFSPDGNGKYGGASPGDGDDPDTQSNLSATRLDPAYRQPLVTHAENQLIIAESAYQTGDQTTALTALNAERAAAGLSTLAGITGPALLDSIMTEKYVALFQNIETWNDYKRECIPALVPAGSAAHVIGRPYYGTSEVNTNPNFPGEPASGRNWNDPNACP
jgi:hypothetical protein